MRRSMLLFPLLAALWTGTTQAQGHPQTREGFWIGFGLGYGSFDAEDQLDGLSLYLAMGGTLNQRVRIGGELNGWTREENGATLSLTSLDAVVQFYPSPTGGFFLKGGLGISQLELDLGIGGNSSRSGGNIILGLGYDGRVGRNFSLTPFANLVAASFDGEDATVVQLGLGFHWH